MLRFIILLSALVSVSTPATSGNNPFWAQQRKGANCQNEDVEPTYWQAASEAGIQFIRLIPDAWESESRDFLIGNADSFTTIDVRDLDALVAALDDAERYGVKVVLAMFSQPGARWVQLNNDIGDNRLWEDQRYHDQSAEFWRQVAARLKDHPAIVAYNPLNEPHPEKAHEIYNAHDMEARTWFASIKGTAADVNEYNRTVVSAIREVDPDTPIILDGPLYTTPGGILHVEPVDDDAVYYAVHFYGSWTYVTYRVNGGRYGYPDSMPAPDGGRPQRWTVNDLRSQMAIVGAWRSRHQIDATRIIVSEFGVDRRVAGAQQYLADIISIVNDAGYHWAFYAYRSDGSWGGMDYELGTGKLGWAYWKAVEAGEDPEFYKQRGDNPLWAVIKRELE